MENVIEVKNLVKKYKIKSGKFGREERTILNGISFSVKKGEVFGLLGPNGAGKTTTFKVLTTLLTPTSGEVFILGKDVNKNEEDIRKEINFIFGGEKGVYTKLTAVEYLAYFCSLYKIPKQESKLKINQLISLVGLEKATDQKIYTFSKGMIQRLHIARSLINDPKVIFLDEPTIGLDPLGARILRDIVKNLSKKGITIILTTHYMYEAEELCDKVAFIRSGEIVESGRKDSVLQKYNHVNIIEITMNIRDRSGLLENEYFKNKVELNDIKENIILVRLKKDEFISDNTIETELSKYGLVLEFKKKAVTLEDIYIELMKEPR